jgi:hypothetical protein
MKKAEFRQAVQALHNPAETGWVAHYSTNDRGDVEASLQLPGNRWYNIQVTPRPELRETHVQVDYVYKPGQLKGMIEEINPDYAFQSRGEAFAYAALWLSKAKGVRDGNIILPRDER